MDQLPETFCLLASASARREDRFQKFVQNERTFPSDFVKLGSKILYLFLAKNGRLFVCFVLFCLLQFYPILAYLFLKEPFLKGKILQSGE